ncbi:MAG: RluA family pseudouridine synthase [Bacteroidales bacterium]|nr:RluA family pseudouridine synthase [Bacteroidales bacterium]
MIQDELNDQQELYEHHRIKVDKGQSPVRIDKYLYHHLGNISRNRIQSAAKAGNILIGGDPVKSSYKVKPGDIISIVLPHPPREFELIPQDIPIIIIYEDDDIIVVNKDPDMVVHPGHGNYTGTLVNALAYHLKDLPLYQKGEIRPGLVHRIDKGTSGILVIAKTDHSLNRLAKQFYDRKTQRTYVALVWGSFGPDAGTIAGNIGRCLKNRLKMQVFEDGDHGKSAITHYKVLENLGYVSLVECRLETGRTHQIRVHMEYAGHPVFNDDRYGGDRILKGTTFSKYKQFVQNCFKLMPRPALHAKSLGFTHPVTGKPMFFDSELAPDMRSVVDKWRNYISNRESEV